MIRYGYVCGFGVENITYNILDDNDLQIGDLEWTALIRTLRIMNFSSFTY